MLRRCYGGFDCYHERETDSESDISISYSHSSGASTGELIAEGQGQRHENPCISPPSSVASSGSPSPSPYVDDDSYNEDGFVGFRSDSSDRSSYCSVGSSEDGYKNSSSEEDASLFGSGKIRVDELDYSDSRSTPSPVGFDGLTLSQRKTAIKEEDLLKTPRWEPVAHAIDISENDFTCPICMDFFQNPTESECCRQLFCTGCIEKLCKSGSKFKCPYCNADSSKERVNNLPSHIKLLKLGMMVKCTADQCSKTFNYQTRLEHLKVCEGIVECRFCDQSFQIKENHKNSCLGYLQDKLRRMEEVLAKNKETLKKKEEQVRNHARHYHY
ncbi:Oidioi.mRNA.OKI2018_I69.XSR.g14713.t1.cds [Oikopleura dioica]|uniref:Oidioi.mRNA.OKI2018_I69.XSR.g14713.t1.cds n=1 Tax=Oikopleura dioica TaxID=34765 RepID=A0ABN7SEN1_OIKDI|nr:Oidioi.mRNA.OKI2018_I69.XSR.g14713.t1.cds [Oikopleura dioica]